MTITRQRDFNAYTNYNELNHKMDKRVKQVRKYVLTHIHAGGCHGIDHWDRVYTNGQLLITPEVNQLVLGLFAYALTNRQQQSSTIGQAPSLRGRAGGEALICIASPLLCYALDTVSTNNFSYHFGYELLMINGAITYLGLCLLRIANSKRSFSR